MNRPDVESAEPTLRYDVTGKRIVAALIDIAVLTGLFVLMALAFGDAGKEEHEDGSTTYIYLRNGPFVLYLLASLGYFVVLEALLGATLGKVVMGLRVVHVDGSRCGWAAIFIRNLLRIVDGLPIFYLVGLIAVAVNEKKQRIGDLAAKTLIVSAR